MPPVNRSRRNRTLATLVGVAVVGGVVSISWVNAASGTQPTITDSVQADAAQVAQVKTAFTEALKADRAADAPAASAHLAAATAGAPAGMPDSSQRQQQLNAGLATLAQYFTPAQAKHEAIGLRNSVTNEADPTFRNLGSGVSKVTFTQVSVSGNQATVQAAVTIWAKFQQQQQSGGKWNTANPVNVMDYTATLVHDSSGKWLISSLKGDFAPNEGP